MQYYNYRHSRYSYEQYFCSVLSYLFALLQETQRIYHITHTLSQLLPTDLQDLAHDMVRNRFINMTHFSETTHLNTVLISGLFCHIEVFLLYAKDITFLDPITLVFTTILHSTRQNTYLRISTSIKPLDAPTPQPSSIRNVIVV